MRFAFHFHSSRVAAAANVDLFSRSISRGSYILTRASFTSHCTIRHDLRINADRPVFDSVATVSASRLRNEQIRAGNLRETCSEKFLCERKSRISRIVYLFILYVYLRINETFDARINEIKDTDCGFVCIYANLQDAKLHEMRAIREN